MTHEWIMAGFDCRWINFEASGPLSMKPMDFVHSLATVLGRCV